MRDLSRTLVVSAPLLLLGCSTALQLTDEGRAVRLVSRADMPTGCNLLGDVAIGIPPDAARPHTEEDLQILLRNKAGELGGNHVVTEMSQRHEDSSGQPYYRGRGTAFACPEPEGGAEPDGATSGGEEAATEPTEEPEGDTGTTSGHSEEEDAMIDDLVGD